METTIDHAGRIVVPKAIRDAMGLTGGRKVDIVYVDGKIEIEVVPGEFDVVTKDGIAVFMPRERASEPELSDETVRETLEAVRARGDM